MSVGPGFSHVGKLGGIPRNGALFGAVFAFVLVVLGPQRMSAVGFVAPLSPLRSFTFPGHLVKRAGFRCRLCH